jgi:hypothetical protein
MKPKPEIKLLTPWFPTTKATLPRETAFKQTISILGLIIKLTRTSLPNPGDADFFLEIKEINKWKL